MAITDYEIIKQIGAGGMGAVYLARDPRLDRLVAIKKLRIQTNIEEDVRKEVLQRFYREARTIANINHPNIVSIYELGEDKETKECFMVMEYLDGQTIEAMLEEKISLSVDEVLKIGIQVTEALAHIHNKGIIHRDIKPSNLILCKNEMVKLTDFGLVRTSDSLELTRAGSLLGSILYMSPEQIMNPKEIDNRVDIYALGVTLYQALSGNFPFEGDDVWEVITKITRDEPVALSKRNPAIPKELEKIIMKAISKRDKRYSKAEDLQMDLFNFNMSNSQTFVSPLGYEKMMKTYLDSNIPQKSKVNQHVGTTPLNISMLPPEFIASDDLKELKEIPKNLVHSDLGQNTIISSEGYSTLEKKNLILKDITIISKDYDIDLLGQMSLDEEDVTEFDNKEKQEDNEEKIVKAKSESFSDNLNLYIKDLKIEIKSCSNIIKNLEKIVIKNNKQENNFVLSNHQLEQIQKKIESYKVIYEYQCSIKNFLTAFEEELDEKVSKSFFKNINSVFQITELDIEKIGELIENKINKLNDIDILNEKIISLSKELEHLNLDISHLEKITSIIRYIPKENSIEARLIKDLRSPSILEIDFDNYEVIFASPTIISDNKNVLKAKKMDIVFLKLDCFGSPIENKININVSIYESNSRVVRKDLLEKELRLYKKLLPYLDKLRPLISNNIVSCFEDLDSLFENIGQVPFTFKFTAESRQVLLSKVSKIKKNLFELKKDFELEEESEKKNYLKYFVKITQTLNRFPFILRDFERVLKSKSEERKKFIQSIFTTISKLEADELKKDFELFTEKINSLKSSEVPISLINVLNFYLNLKTKKPTEVSKNEIVENLNKERIKLSTPEIDWVCKILDLKYTRERGFIFRNYS